MQDDAFKKKVRKFDIWVIQILINIYVSIFTTLAILTILKVIQPENESAPVIQA